MLVRLIPHWGEAYARYVYPTLSSLLSWFSAIVPFSLDEWIVIAIVLTMLIIPFYARRKAKKITYILLIEAEILCWTGVWFYLGWGMNYFRDPLLQRVNATPCEVNTNTFTLFLSEYTDSLNATYSVIDKANEATIIAEVKSIYDNIPEQYGLLKTKSYQKPKTVCFNWLYSSVGVLGYMGPFADESHLNQQLLPVQYAFTYAHELAHLLSVSSEAEANYWAYTICRRSKDKAIRYSAYFGILPNVMRNARNILSEDEYTSWVETIDKRIILQREQQSKFWRSQLSPMLLEIQKTMFEALLKGNRISDGRKNYDQVLNLILALDR